MDDVNDDEDDDSVSSLNGEKTEKVGFFFLAPIF